MRATIVLASMLAAAAPRKARERAGNGFPGGATAGPDRGGNAAHRAR